MGYDSGNKITGLFSKQCQNFENKTDVAATLLARDYKGFGNQAMNGVLEVNEQQNYSVR